ncbi:MAG TPA: hypothetical protein VGQ52_20235 [Gemmatimonadaceae bacterium]|nr:hypothetical protein [Gemmatimonadaceae bacterium]
MRGGAVALAALVFPLAAATARGQPTRTRDVGFAVVRYDKNVAQHVGADRALGAITLNEALFSQTARTLSYANGLLSMFDDGRFSLQGTLAGARYSAPISAPTLVNRAFNDYQGDFTLSAATTAQDGFMPTLHLVLDGGVTLASQRRALRNAIGMARTFDGTRWRTTVLGSSRFWMEQGRARYAFNATPVQLQGGDILSDFEGTWSWEGAGGRYELIGGLRTGEGIIGKSTWGGFSASWPIFAGAYLAVSVGSYPVDLLQSLPGGRYAALSVRVPPKGFSQRSRALPRIPVVPPPPIHPELPTQYPIAVVVGEAYDSLYLREVRVWAPGNPVVELLADFTDWVAVPLVRQVAGDWLGYYRVPPGARRVNLRLNGREVVVPMNLSEIDDEFSGRVGVLIVK